MATVEDSRSAACSGAVDAKTATRNLIKALGKGVRRRCQWGVDGGVLHRRQIFERSGWAAEVIDSCFTGTTSRLGGVGFDTLADEVASGT